MSDLVVSARPKLELLRLVINGEVCENMLLTAETVDTKDVANEEELNTCTEELNDVWTFTGVDESSANVVVVEARYVNIETEVDCCINDLEDDPCKVIGDDTSCGVVVAVISNVGEEDVTPLVKEIEEEETPGEAKLEFLSNEVESNILV